MLPVVSTHEHHLPDDFQNGLTLDRILERERSYVGWVLDLTPWGSDTWTSEEAIGALLAWQYVVATVLSEKVDSGYFDMAEAEALVHKLMYRNAARLYGFDLA